MARTVRRKRKTTRKSVKKQSPVASLLKNILPESFQAFVARRLVDGISLLMIAGGVFVALSLYTYHPADPSLNTAVGKDYDIHNWGGHLGAFISDSLIQGFGVASFLVALTFCVWGIRLMKRHRIRSIMIRGLSLILALISGAIFVSALNSLQWIQTENAGGSFGYLTIESLNDVFNASYALYVTAFVCVLFGFGFLVYALACPASEIVRGFGFVKSIIVFSVMTVLSSLYRFKNWVSHYNDPNYQPKPLFPDMQWPKLELPTFKLPERRPQSQIHEPELRAEHAKPSTAVPAPEPSFTEKRMVADKKPVPVVKSSKKEEPSRKLPNQQNLSLTEHGEWEFPPISLIADPPPPSTMGQLDEAALRRNAELLQNVLSDYGVDGEIVSIRPGPVVTLYELEPAPGTKSSKIINLSDDIARSMAALSVRCSVISGRNVIGIEIPNKNRQTVYLQDILRSPEFTKHKKALPLILGKDIGGKTTMADLSKMPHLLVAGTTGSGKSVAVNTMILSLLYSMSPEQCRFIMIDPKMLELSVYADIPHLLSPVVTEPGKAVVALKWAVAEMEDRYRAMSKLGVRNLEGYNARVREAAKNGETIMTKVQTGFDPETGKPEFEEQAMDLTELPLIVIIVDEFADLMLVAGKDVENAIQRLAQMARAAGIHLIMATQRPSVDVITGVIKANFPTRISFQVTSKIDSRTILGEGGAEQLLGMGDMLFMAPGGQIQRVHGPFASDTDVENVVEFLKAQRKPDYISDVTEGGDFGDSEVMNAMFGGSDSGGEKVDELYDEAVAIIAREGKASTSFVQRHLQIGYNRAARIIEEMERQGVISKASATGKREVLVSDHSSAA